MAVWRANDSDRSQCRHVPRDPLPFSQPKLHSKQRCCRGLLSPRAHLPVPSITSRADARTGPRDVPHSVTRRMRRAPSFGDAPGVPPQPTACPKASAAPAPALRLPHRGRPGPAPTTGRLLAPLLPKPVPPGCRRGCEAGSGARPGTGNWAEGRLGAERRAAARSGALGLDAVTRRRRAARWLLASDKMNKCIAL